MNAAEREKLYTDYLRAEGYRPDLEQNGWVAFSKGNQKYFIIIDADPEFFVIMLPWRSLQDEKLTADKAIKAALYATDQSRVAKVFVSDDKVFIEVQMFVKPPESFRHILARSMKALDQAEKFYLQATGRG